ncbi:MAG TPA: 6-phosphogluconolactonase [Tianweitania sediminis]|jgi:6-phosphogluconolactonase|nr:6-phosphogluconolactonase [Tianweitania sediminis]
MRPEPIWHDFDTPTLLAERFADDVAAALGAAMADRGLALLAVSGGTTPAPFFRALSQRELDWSKIHVAPVDERFVPTTSERSNEKLIRENLLINKAAAASFTPLYHETMTVQEAAIAAERGISVLPLPFDMLILGMGGDGHTASFFPDSPHLADVLDPKTPRLVLSADAPSANEPRLTLTLPVVVAARRLTLHIEGNDKRALFETILRERQDKPIGIVIEQSPRPVDVYWAPKESELS